MSNKLICSVLKMFQCTIPLYLKQKNGVHFVIKIKSNIYMYISNVRIVWNGSSIGYQECHLFLDSLPIENQI